MVSIIAPVNSVDEVEPLVSAGAGELYCGLIDDKWAKKYSPVCAPNRREWRECNLESFSELSAVVEEGHCLGAPVSLAVNAPYFAQCQMRDLKVFLERACACGVDAFMVADLGCMTLLRELDLGVSVHVSSVAGVFNSRTASFYRKLGAERIILPRHLTLSEIRSIVSARSDMEFEVFTLFNRCVHSDGYCTFLHGSPEYGLGANACTLAYDVYGQPDGRRIRGKVGRYLESFRTRDGVLDNLSFQCGLCALYDLHGWGVHGAKVVGRGNPLWMKKMGVELMSNILKHVEEDKPDRGEFVRDVRSVVENTVFSDRRRTCTGMNCFFPELIEDGEGGTV